MSVPTSPPAPVTLCGFQVGLTQAPVVPRSTPDSGGSGGLSSGAVAGIVVGGLLGLALLALAVAYLRWRRVWVREHGKPAGEKGAKSLEHVDGCLFGGSDIEYASPGPSVLAASQGSDAVATMAAAAAAATASAGAVSSGIGSAATGARDSVISGASSTRSVASGRCPELQLLYEFLRSVSAQREEVSFRWCRMLPSAQHTAFHASVLPGTEPCWRYLHGTKPLPLCFPLLPAAAAAGAGDREGAGELQVWSVSERQWRQRRQHRLHSHRPLQASRGLCRRCVGWHNCLVKNSKPATGRGGPGRGRARHSREQPPLSTRLIPVAARAACPPSRARRSLPPCSPTGRHQAHQDVRRRILWRGGQPHRHDAAPPQSTPDGCVCVNGLAALQLVQLATVAAAWCSTMLPHTPSIATVRLSLCTITNLHCRCGWPSITRRSWQSKSSPRWDRQPPRYSYCY